MSDRSFSSEGATLLATAITGRSVPVVPIERGVTYTDGEVIYASASGGLDGVVVQAALLAAGSLEVGMSKLLGRRGSRSRYLTLEAQRAARLVDDVAPRRVLARVAGLYDGTPSSSAEESLRRAASTRVPEAPEWCGELRPAKLLRLRNGASGEVTEAMIRHALQPTALDELDDADADDADRSAVLDLLSAPINNTLAAKFARMLGMGGAPASGQDGAGDDTAMRSNRRGRGLAGATRVAETATATLGTPGALSAGRRYPEWSVQRGAYRSDWCTVAEFDPPVTVDTEPLLVEPDLWLRKHLAQLGLADEAHRRQGDGDALDITALIEFAADRRAGRAGDARVYEQRRSTGHDLGVLILLDASGSTGESADGRQIFAGERGLAARLAVELEALGNRVAVHGFSSRGKDDVRFLRAKTFDEPLGHTARRRLAAIEPGGFTRLGAAVRHATHVLRAQAGTSKLLLVVVGDGLPYEDGYEHRHAYEDTRRALAEAVRGGVACACIAMRSPTRSDVIERVWGHVAHCHLDDPHQLAGEVRPLLRRALRDAAAQRRDATAIPEAA